MSAQNGLADQSCVLLASWNGERYIEEQLDSIASQSCSAGPVIVRDDASSDRTLAVIEEWKSRHPETDLRLIAGHENQGYIANFSSLMRLAQEEWIFLSDQDDRWHAGKAQKMLETVKKNPRIRLLASSFAFMNADSKVFELPLRAGWSNHNLIPWQVENPGGLNWIDEEKMLEHNYFQGCAMLVHRSIVRQYLDLEDHTVAHDWMLAYLASRQNGLAYLDEELFDYRIHSSNTTGLPQAHKRSKIHTIRTWFNGYYRKAAVLDMARLLSVLEKKVPGAWNAQRQNRLDYCRKYLRALEGGSLRAYWKLRKHPGKSGCMSRKEYAVGAAYLLVSKFCSLPQERLES